MSIFGRTQMLNGLLLVGMAMSGSGSVVATDETASGPRVMENRVSRLASLPTSKHVLDRVRKVAPELLDDKAATALMGGLEALKKTGRQAVEQQAADSSPAGGATLTDGGQLPPACYTTDPVANITNFVNVLFPGDLSYWLNYRTSGSIHSVVFLVTPLETSVLTSAVQTFEFPQGYEGTVTTPFGIPFWPNGNLTEGWWVLMTRTDTQDVQVWYFYVAP